MTKRTTDLTALTGDAAQAVAVLAWAQEVGLSVASLTVGACHIDLHRSPVTRAAEDDKPEDDAIEDVYRRAVKGSPLEGMDFGIPGGEMQPVVGRTR